MLRLLMFQKSISLRLMITCESQKLYCSIILNSHSLFWYSLFVTMHCFSSAKEVRLALCRSISLFSIQQAAQLSYWMLMPAITYPICSMASILTFWGMIQSVKKRSSSFLQIYISYGQQQYQEIERRCLKYLRLLGNQERWTITLPNWRQLRNSLSRVRLSEAVQVQGQCRENVQSLGWVRKYWKNALFAASLLFVILYPTVQKQWLSSCLSLAKCCSTSSYCSSVTYNTSSQKLTCSSSTLSGVSISTNFFFPSLSYRSQTVSRLMGRLKQIKSLTQDPSNPEKQKRVLFLMQNPGFLLPFGFWPLISICLHWLFKRSISMRSCRSLLFCLPPKTQALLPFESEIWPQRTISSRDCSFTYFQASSFMSLVARNSEKSKQWLSSRQSYFPEHPPMMYSLLLQTNEDANFLAVGLRALFCGLSSLHW